MGLSKNRYWSELPFHSPGNLTNQGIEPGPPDWWVDSLPLATRVLASMQEKKQHLEMDIEQRTVSKLGKDFFKAVYCHPAYLTYMQITS